ncbi:hypothetical protein R2F25_09935 [Streptomyces sp. UP1A-1]|nr:hypothetical protein [Streptomyces sp. UP1A-1]
MHLSAELIGGAVTLVGLGILTLASIRSIGRARILGRAADPAADRWPTQRVTGGRPSG